MAMGSTSVPIAYSNIKLSKIKPIKKKGKESGKK